MLAIAVSVMTAVSDTFAIEKMAQTVCPMSGKPIEKSVYSDHDGKRVYFCCPDCEEAFKKDPEKYIKKLEKEGVKLDKVS